MLKLIDKGGGEMRLGPFIKHIFKIQHFYDQTNMYFMVGRLWRSQICILMMPEPSVAGNKESKIAHALWL